MKIQVLPEDLINKIAAGEVVERPASVVKELVENSLDAGATQIIVEIQEAGKKLIRVSDNGCGMSEAEIEISLERHSTSKIASVDDLFNIQTLGFRGEALPSIASVSKMKIERNPSGSGVTVEAKNLFYNTPARKKFLKADSTEVGHIGEIVSKYALAYPQTAFRLISDGKPLINSPGTGKLIDAILAVYGTDLSRGLVEVNNEFAAGKVYGFISRPTVTRIDKNYETFFVNRRYIKNFLLNRALEEAYRTLIPSNRYPVAVLFIEIDPRQVDVNVHPAKREVKFLKTNEVMEAVRSAVRKSLEVGDMGKGREAGLVESNKRWGIEQPVDQLPMTSFQTSNPTFTQYNNYPEAEIEVTAIQPLIPLYQLKLTYIVATDGEELALIDQHAAHERILYDQLTQGARVNGQGAQTLLVPETIDLVTSEAEILKDNLEYLNSLGFDLELFGSNSYILRAVPAVSSKSPAKQLILDIIAELGETGKSVQLEVKQENLRKLVACHSAIKAGDKLTAQEMNQLIRDLYTTQNPLTCPHGRPTMIRLTEAELLKRFGR